MTVRAKACLGPAALAAILAMTGSLPAAEKKPAPEKLPGVEGDYRIVKPYAPDTEPDDAPAAKIGEWDVRISGTLTVDVGTGGLSLPRN